MKIMTIVIGQQIGGRRAASGPGEYFKVLVVHFVPSSSHLCLLFDTKIGSRRNVVVMTPVLMWKKGTRVK